MSAVLSANKFELCLEFWQILSLSSDTNFDWKIVLGKNKTSEILCLFNYLSEDKAMTKHNTIIPKIVTSVK